ncbi:MAG TPA: hypothetical protein DD490_24415 [Acidobacteria bacterium]|nr:hypothetical protein [Acidobacteriota bacterium]
MASAPWSNGIDAATGGYLADPPAAADLARALVDGKVAFRPEASGDSAFDLIDEAEAGDLGSAGWGVLFAEGTSPGVREALAPLLELRREQASRRFDRGYREIVLPPAAAGAFTAEGFLRGHGAAVDGPVDPEEMPYYLLLVGGPEEIGFDFQYGLDAQHAVGRLCFDRLEDYAAYAEAVVRAEKGRSPRRRGAAVFGVRNEDDPASARTLTDLAIPLADVLGKNLPDGSIERILEEEATKARLERLLRETPPALLLTTGHGLARKSGDPRQSAEQGAIVCRDWPGRRVWNRSLVPEHYFAADDLSRDADLTGLIAFCFACFSAGTPATDDFAHLAPDWPAVAERPFVSRLAQRLLAQGALAVIGHVDRVWLHSFYLDTASARETRTFEQTLSRLLRGLPAGHAMDLFNRRWGTVASRLSILLHRFRLGEAVQDTEVGEAFLTCNDARNYVLLGDPAVRLSLV